MEYSVRKSCWGVTLWTVAIFSVVLLLGFLFSAPETITLAAG